MVNFVILNVNEFMIRKIFNEHNLKYWTLANTRKNKTPSVVIQGLIETD